MEEELNRVNKICHTLFKKINNIEINREKSFLILIVDSVLQQGMNYKTFVLPRLINIENKYLNIDKVSKIKLDNEYIEKILQVKNQRKIATFREIIKLFMDEKLETYQDIFNWLGNKKNHIKLLDIYGFGNKTLDYLLNLFGYQNIPIDRHIYSFLKMCNVNINNYEKASKLLDNVAENNNFCKISFDKEIWSYIRGLQI